MGFPGGSVGRPAMQETQEMKVWSLGLGRSPGGGNGNILAWETPWTEEPGGLQSMGSERVRHDWSDWSRTHAQLENIRFVDPPRSTGQDECASEPVVGKKPHATLGCSSAFRLLGYSCSQPLAAGPPNPRPRGKLSAWSPEVTWTSLEMGAVGGASTEGGANSQLCALLASVWVRLVWPPSWTSPVAQTLKNLPAVQESWIRFLGREDALEEGVATHSSTLAWRIPWTEEPGGPQFMGL